MQSKVVAIMDGKLDGGWKRCRIKLKRVLDVLIDAGKHRMLCSRWAGGKSCSRWKINRLEDDEPGIPCKVLSSNNFIYCKVIGPDRGIYASDLLTSAPTSLQKSRK